MQIIITSPSLDTAINVSGISTVTQFIIDNNDKAEYIHFELGRKDAEKGGLRRIPAILNKLKQWKKLLRKYPHAIIHYNFPLAAPSILRDPCFMLLARLFHRKMLIHIHGGQYLFNAKLPFALKCILRWVFNAKCPVVVLSASERDILIEKYGCKDVRVLPNCVARDDYEPKSRHEAIQLAYLGRIAKTKGMEELLEACVALKNQGLSFHLNIAGVEENTGEFLPRFKDQLNECFTYWGTVSGVTKTEFLRNTDIFILPSYFEGLPMCLLESMSYGCVSLVTPVGSVPSVVNDGENGIFINIKDVNSIVEKVLALVENPQQMLKLSESAVRTIQINFSTEDYIANLNLIYKALYVI